LEKREKFVRLAEARTAKAMQSIRVIGNLANKSNYDYTDDDVRKISKTLHAEVDAMVARFRNTDSKSRPVFKL
jgi:hypothetical protein